MPNFKKNTAENQPLSFIPSKENINSHEEVRSAFMALFDLYQYTDEEVLGTLDVMKALVLEGVAFKRGALLREELSRKIGEDEQVSKLVGGEPVERTRPVEVKKATVLKQVDKNEEELPDDTLYL